MSNEISLIPAMKISASGLDAESRRMEVIANNVANAHTTIGADGKPFRKKEAIFAEKLAKAAGNRDSRSRMQGVRLAAIVPDSRELKRVYKPGHPDADKDGYVSLPNIDPMEEMVNMMSCTRAYEANLAVIKASRSMAQQALDIGKK